MGSLLPLAHTPLCVCVIFPCDVANLSRTCVSSPIQPDSPSLIYKCSVTTQQSTFYVDDIHLLQIRYQMDGQSGISRDFIPKS